MPTSHHINQPSPKQSLESQLIAISRKTLMVSLGLVTLIVVIANLALGYYGIVRDSQSKAQVLAENTAILVVFRDIRALERAISALENSPEIQAAALYDLSGKLLVSYPPADSGKQPADNPHLQGGLMDWQTLSIVQIIEHEGEYFGMLNLKVSLHSLYWEVLWLLLVTVLAGACALWLTQILLHRLNSSLLRPLRQLGQAMEQVETERDYARVHRVRSNILEFSQLAAGFNQMLSEIDRRERDLQSYQEHLEDLVAERTADLAISRDAADQARQLAERANRAKSEFLSRMSHELRTPLNAILGFGQLLQIAEMNPDDLESVDEILKAGHHLLGLVNEILDLSRIESGRLELKLEAVFICEATHECIDLLRPLAEKREIRIHLPTCDQSERISVQADKKRLSQIMLNLLSNAIKYNREGGEIFIDWQADGEKMRVTVRDTGNGIAPENIDRLFRPFERLEGAYNGIEGSGIGLALVKRLIEAMAGQVGVDSQPGVGSCFWFEVPRYRN